MWANGDKETTRRVAGDVTVSMPDGVGARYEQSGEGEFQAFIPRSYGRGSGGAHECCQDPTCLQGSSQNVKRCNHEAGYTRITSSTSSVNHLPECMV